MNEKAKPLYLQADYIDKKIETSFLWLNGTPKHDDVYDECCSDFSCCYPDLFEKDVDKRLRMHINFFDKLLKRRNG